MKRLVRKWINQPSSSQPYHKLHGCRVLYDPNTEEIWFTDEDVTFQQIMPEALSDGWPNDKITGVAKRSPRYFYCYIQGDIMKDKHEELGNEQGYRRLAQDELVQTGDETYGVMDIEWQPTNEFQIGKPAWSVGGFNVWRRPAPCSALPRLNVRCECHEGIIHGSTYLNVIRVEEEDDGSFTAVTDHWPNDQVEFQEGSEAE